MPAIKGQPSKRKGIPNKATRDAREAITRFVDDNAERLQGWLDQIANGVPMVDAEGLRVVDEHGRVRWEVPPNPQKAFEMVQTCIEFAVPKLARQELTGPGGEALVVNVNLGPARADD